MKISVLFCLVCGMLWCSPTSTPSQRHTSREQQRRLTQLVEANIIATHAYQILLAGKANRVDANCYERGVLTDADLETLEKHQASLLRSNPRSVSAWVRGHRSDFDPARDLEPILAAKLNLAANLPVNVMTEYLREQTHADRVGLRAIANLYQTVLEVERDGDRLQEEMAFYIALDLPIYVGQLKLPGSDKAFLAAGRRLAPRTCRSPFDTGPAEWQIAGRKIWNWGEKNLHVRDEKVLANELLRESDIKSLVPRIRAVPAQKIAVVGHSFTMGLHWSSPSSFVPVVTQIFKEINPRVEIKQFAAGGLTASRAKNKFYEDVLAWRPDQILLVVVMRTDEDYAALKQMAEGFAAAGIKLTAFDRMNDSNTLNPTTAVRAEQAARDSGFTVIEVGAVLAASPHKDQFYCLDKIHMTEPYHRLMAKEWLKFLVGARDAQLTSAKRVL